MHHFFFTVFLFGANMSREKAESHLAQILFKFTAYAMIGSEKLSV